MSIEILLVNMGLCYVDCGTIIWPINTLEQAFSICGNNCDDYFLMSAHYCLGMMSFDRKSLDTAESEFLKSYVLSKRINDTRFQLDNLTYCRK